MPRALALRCVPCLLLLALALLPFPAPRPVRRPRVTGAHDGNLAAFDEMMVEFVTRHDVPGAALAVAKDGRLVYARGFGLADVENGQPVLPTSRFRIASLSKPITAAAILRLVQEGKLRLDDRLLRVLKLNPPLPTGKRVDPRLADVTIRHLLQHRGGWDRGKSFDPMTDSWRVARATGSGPPARPTDIIRFMTTRRLDFTPGTRYTYSNYGYCLLGRVIESVTGKPYDEYVREAILAPLGVRNMQLGKTLAADRAAGEVKYYGYRGRTATAVVGPDLGKKVPWPYGGWYLEAMDAHGGWIASAPELVRFVAAFDCPDRCPILNAESVRTLFAPPPGKAGHLANGRPKEVYYACGWSVRRLGGGKVNAWHDGLLDGTAALLVRRWDGLAWAVLFNTHCDPEGRYLGALIDPLVHEAADHVKVWPTRDLFAE
jgi:N-acyl-D-amino-acid deacylase